MERAYSKSEVCHIALVSARQLQWWDETNILSPVQVDHRRLYQPREVFGALLIRELRERGFPLSRVRTVWKQAQRQGFTLPDDSKKWMVTNGKRVVFLAHADVVLAFLEQRRKPAYVLISLTALAQRMAEHAALFARRGPDVARALGTECPEALRA